MILFMHGIYSDLRVAALPWEQRGHVGCTDCKLANRIKEARKGFDCPSGAYVK